MFNERVFESQLPEDMSVGWNNRLTSTAGMTKCKRVHESYSAVIELSTKAIDSEERLKLTLLHEMCHAAAWLLDHNGNPPHGPVFWKWANRASAAFPDLEVTTCHNYAIHKPYQYKCNSCGVTHGRHSKNSIKIDIHRCGCGGRLNFEGVFNPDGTPKKARAASGFR